jgi:hypothetical protein
LRRFAVIGAALIGEDGVRDVTIAPRNDAAAVDIPAVRYPAPAVGLPPWYRFATDRLLLRYIAGGGGRYTN